MKILHNEPLSKYTTIRIGGTAENLYFPQTTEELIEITQQFGLEYIIGGGSNLLINDEKVFPNVICLTEFNKTIKKDENDVYTIGSGVRLQTLIQAINSDGFGGIEYLYSVPGLVGGAIVMNAGRGRNHGKTISDYVISVQVLKDNKVVSIEKEKCEFKHRSSIFKNSDYIVLSVELKFPVQDRSESKKLRKERIQLCKDHQDNSCPNFGSVFKDSSGAIMKFVKKIGLKRGKVRFSKKTMNWILKDRDGTFRDAVKAINAVKKMHRLIGKKAECEVIIWE